MPDAAVGTRALPRRVRGAFAVTLVSAALMLAGCTAGDTAGAPTPRPSATASATSSPLEPVVPAALTADSAKTETVRIADAIVALVAQVGILHVDDHSQLVAATSTAGAYYGVLRTLTLDPSIDPVALSKSMVRELTAAGWASQQTTDTTGTHIVALSSGQASADPWFLILGGDASVAGESVLSVQLASPDIP